MIYDITISLARERDNFINKILDDADGENCVRYEKKTGIKSTSSSR